MQCHQRVSTLLSNVLSTLEVKLSMYLMGLCCSELVPYDIVLVGLHTISFHLCMLRGGV